MSDQQRWFKLWCSAPSDDHLQRLPVIDRWAWAVLGTYTKLHGTRGVVSVSPTNAVLAAEMGIPVTDLVTTMRRLPHVDVAENGHGDFTVTWSNWIKYQEDTTQAERQRTSRAKKRGDEKRRDEKKYPPVAPPTEDVKPIPPSILDALRRTPLLGAVPRLQTPAFWQATIRATNGRIEYGQELLRAEAWLSANPSRAPRKDLARFVHNWIVRAGERL